MQRRISCELSDVRQVCLLQAAKATTLCRQGLYLRLHGAAVTCSKQRCFKPKWLQHHAVRTPDPVCRILLWCLYSSAILICGCTGKRETLLVGMSSSVSPWQNAPDSDFLPMTTVPG